MSNLVEIQSQIEKLQKQALEIRSREFDKTVRDILATMEAFGITVKDLSAGKSRLAVNARAKAKTKAEKPPVANKVKRGASSAVPAKYRGPAGESWSGRGLTPRWLAALVAQGKAKEEFAVKS